MFSNNKYWCICFNIAIAVSLFEVIGSVTENSLMSDIALFVDVAALIGVFIFLLIGKKIKTPPPMPLRNLGDLFYPYIIALSTAIYSINGPTITLGYWIALLFAIIIIIANSVPMFKKDKEDNSSNNDKN